MSITDLTNPEAWMRRARSNLARAKATRNIPEVLLEDLCFDTQQVAEKSIKAILVCYNVDFPKTHSIADLLSLVYQHGIAIPESIKEASILTRYAVHTRYPSMTEVVTEEEYHRAVCIAKQVFSWAETILMSQKVKCSGSGGDNSQCASE